MVCELFWLLLFVWLLLLELSFTLGNDALFDENALELVMEFDEIATSDGVTPIHFYVFQYNGILNGELTTSVEIEKFLWYQSKNGDEILSNTLKHKVVPYCLDELKAICPVFEEDIYEEISMETCVNNRLTIGAPGKAAMEKVIEAEKAYLAEDWKKETLWEKGN